MPLIRLRKLPAVPRLLRVFIRKRRGIFSNAFPASVEMIRLFCFVFVNIENYVRLFF